MAANVDQLGIGCYACAAGLTGLVTVGMAGLVTFKTKAETQQSFLLVSHSFSW